MPTMPTECNQISSSPEIARLHCCIIAIAILILLIKMF